MVRVGIKHPVRGWDASVSAVVRPLILPAIKTLTLAGYSEQSPTHANANLRSDPTPERTNSARRRCGRSRADRQSALWRMRHPPRVAIVRCPADCQSATGSNLRDISWRVAQEHSAACEPVGTEYRCRTFSQSGRTGFRSKSPWERCWFELQ